MLGRGHSVRALHVAMGRNRHTARWADVPSKGQGSDVAHQLAEKEKTVRQGLVTNFESCVGGAGFIDTVIFGKNSTEVLSTFPRTLDHNVI